MADEDSLLVDYDRAAADLNSLGQRIVALSTEPVNTPEEATARKNGAVALSHELELYNSRVSDLRDRQTVPTHYVARSKTVDLPLLAAQRDAFAQTLHAEELTAGRRSVLLVMTQTITTISETIYYRMEQLQASVRNPDLSVQGQQEALSDMNAKIAELEQLLQQLPDDPEADGLREKVKLDLLRFGEQRDELQKRLNEREAFLTSVERSIEDLEAANGVVADEIATLAATDMDQDRPIEYWTRLRSVADVRMNIILNLS